MAPVLRVAGRGSDDAVRLMRQGCCLATDMHTIADNAREIVDELNALNRKAALDDTPPPFPSGGGPSGGLSGGDVWLSWMWDRGGWHVIRWDGRHWELV